MRNLTIKNIVDFRDFSDKRKQNFAQNLKTIIAKTETGGGNYWVRSISAIRNSFKTDSLQPISDKIDELKDLLKATTYNRTKTQYSRNIKILRQFENLDLNTWKPPGKITRLRQYKENQVLTIEGLQIKVNPDYVYSFENEGNKEVGAIWFIAKKDGFIKDDLSMFADVLYKYLDVHYSNDHIINPVYCIAVDLFNGVNVNYIQLDEKTGIHKRLLSTLREIRALI